MNKKNVVIKARYDELINTLTVPKDEREEHYLQEHLDLLSVIRLDLVNENWFLLLLDCFSEPVVHFSVFLSNSYHIRYEGIEGKSEFYFYKSLYDNISGLQALLEKTFFVNQINANTINYTSISSSDLESLDFLKEGNDSFKYLRPFFKSDIYDLNDFLNNEVQRLKNDLGNKLMNINKSVQKQIFTCVEDYFEESEYDNLKLSLEGYEVSEKLCFNGNLKNFTDLFRRLKKSNVIKDDIVDIKKWMVSNFKTKKWNKFVSINSSTVHEYLTKAVKKEVKVGERICLDIYKEI